MEEKEEGLCGVGLGRVTGGARMSSLFGFAITAI